jgi:hypothetical protein
MYKEADEREINQVLACESRCDSEDTSCPEHCELIEKVVP